jgi:hypothetical protein
VITSFAQADDLEQVAMAGSRSAASLDTLRGERRTAAAVDSELGRELTSVLDAEVAVVVAGAIVADLDADNYSSWGSAHQSLTTSLARLTATSTRMTARDKGLASTIPDARDVLPNLETVVGTAVAETASSSLTHDLGDVAAAETTADVRDVAESAARDSDALTAAVAGLPKRDLATQRLDTFAGVYVAIARLSALDGDSLGRWGDMRRTITTALGAVPPGTPVTGAGHTAIDRLNALVADAQTQLTDWQSTHDAAVKKKASDSAALAKYRSAMEAQMREYSALRSDLSQWIDRVEDPTITVTYDDAYAELSQARWDRQAIRDQMNASSVPDGL